MMLLNFRIAYPKRIIIIRIIVSDNIKTFHLVFKYAELHFIYFAH